MMWQLSKSLDYMKHHDFMNFTKLYTLKLQRSRILLEAIRSLGQFTITCKEMMPSLACVFDQIQNVIKLNSTWR